MSNPLAPSQVGALGVEAWDVFVSGELAYVTDGDGVRVVDVSNPSAPVQVGQVRAVRSQIKMSRAIFVSADMLFIADEGLSIVDMSDPTAPVEVGYLEFRGNVYDIFVSGGLAYIANGRLGLRIVDVSEPTAPVEVSRLVGP